MESINTSFLDKEKPTRDIINGPNKRKPAISTKGELEQKMNSILIPEDPEQVFLYQYFLPH